jgi:hypothetical protein
MATVIEARVGCSFFNTPGERWILGAPSATKRILCEWEAGE